MKRILLTQGKYALIDDTDYAWLSGAKWGAEKHGNTWYAKHSNSDGTKVYMHNLIMNTPKGMVVDHINHNGLDNRRANLRIATYSENNANQFKQENKVSRFKGVTWDDSNKKWRAQITVGTRNHFLGHFDKEADAAHAYDRASKFYFGEFAVNNEEIARQGGTVLPPRETGMADGA